MGDESPLFWIKSLEKDAVCCVVAAWAATPSAAWTLRSSVRERLNREFRERGIATMQGRLEVAGAGGVGSAPLGAREP